MIKKNKKNKTTTVMMKRKKKKKKKRKKMKVDNGTLENSELPTMNSMSFECGLLMRCGTVQMAVLSLRFLTPITTKKWDGADRSSAAYPSVDAPMYALHRRRHGDRQWIPYNPS